MNIDEVISTLELDEETAKLVRAKAKAEKAALLKQQKEFDALEAKRVELEAALNGGNGKQGAAAYQKWYDENFPKIQVLQAERAKYEERYGKLDASAAPPAAAPAGNYISKEDFEKYSDSMGKQMSAHLINSGTILEKHIRAGRKNPLDWNKLGELASQKGGDLVAAYNEWDAPEAEKAAKESEEKRINAEVEKRLKAQQTNSFFPSTEQVSTGVSPLSRDRGDNTPKYDRSKVIESAVTGLYEPSTVH